MNAADFAAQWTLDPQVTYLNHGSFGACPRPILALQIRLREELEQAPMRFFVRELEGRLENARIAIGQFVGADAQDLVFVPNATAGVNTVLRSLDLAVGDELITTNHEYNACKNALDFAAAKAGARVVVASVPFPLNDPEQVVEAVMRRVGPRTRLALLDHVTSQTALVFPIARLVSQLAARGVDTLVDGAHAPGMVPVDLTRIGAAYYTANCHKWLCAPKGAAFLHVRRDRQAQLRPLSISHGANSPRTDRSRFRIEFDWTGTTDPTAWLCVPDAIHWLGQQVNGGWPALMAHNRTTALTARQRLCATLDIAPPAPEAMIGSMASIPLPAGGLVEPTSPLYADPLQDSLREQHRIEVPIVPWPAPPARLLRISAQLYNDAPQYERLAEALRQLLR